MVANGRAGAAEEPAGAIERALAAALVSYYPIAGRLAESEDGGGLVVDCTGEGVWFIEATASCSLEDVDYLEYPLMVDKDELLPHPTYPASDHLPEDSIILLVQVTQFACGGFVVGFRFSHAVADGPGAAQFMTADPYRITSDYRTLLVSDWSRLGFAEVDYGWGAPVHVVPLTNLDYIATCILVRPSAHKPGARLITQCVAADGVDAFHKDMMRLD
uniref:Uncharacterized protein n=1 Tax=Oryza brachyantha TaxID=4533 RepID=J3MFH3_ORYBR